MKHYQFETEAATNNLVEICKQKLLNFEFLDDKASIDFCD